MRNIFFVIILAIFSTVAHANKVWECVSAQGSHVYQDQPCADNPQAEPVHGYDAKPKYSNNPPETGLEPVQPRIAVAPTPIRVDPNFVMNAVGASASRTMGSMFSYIIGFGLLLAIVSALINGSKKGKRTRRPGKGLYGFFEASPKLSTVKPVSVEKRAEPVATATASPSYFVRGRFLSPHEIEMFKLLLVVVPAGWHVFTQVSLGQMLQATGGNKFENDGLRFKVAQKAADFVICQPDLSIALVVELDDRTHLGKEDKDNERDAFLLQAGIPTKRYFHVPPVDHLREYIAVFTKAAAGVQ